MFAQTSKTGKCVITINTVSSSHGEPVRLTKSVPASGAVIAFKSGDVLIGNIRPYLKKIWLADCDGGTNGDVLAVQINDRSSLRKCGR